MKRDLMEEVVIRENKNRIDYQYGAVTTMTGAGVFSSSFVWQGAAVNIQNKRLRLVGLSASCFLIPAAAGQNTNVEFEMSVSQGPSSGAVVPLIPKGGAMAINTDVPNGTTSFSEQPQFAIYNSSWGGNRSYNHLFTESFAISLNRVVYAGNLAIGDIVQLRAWLTFIQEKSAY